MRGILLCSTMLPFKVSRHWSKGWCRAIDVVNEFTHILWYYKLYTPSGDISRDIYPFPVLPQVRGFKEKEVVIVTQYCL